MFESTALLKKSGVKTDVLQLQRKKLAVTRFPTLLL